MNRNYVTISTALVLMLAGAVGAAEVKTQHVHCNGSGTFADGVETNIDTDGNGVSATLDQGLENCNTGRFFFQEEAEWIPQPTVTTCPNVPGMVEEHIDQTIGGGQQRSVATDEKTGDQIFLRSPRQRSVSISRPFLSRLSRPPPRGNSRLLGGPGNTPVRPGLAIFSLPGAS